MHLSDAALRAPVLVLTCNRARHFKALVESLVSCTAARETELYIAVDGPFEASVVSSNDEIVRCAESLTGFRRVHVIRRSQNVGPMRNFRLAIDEVFRDHDTCIFLEDDNVVAKNFLTFMNAALAAFLHRPECFSVCGYNLPVTRPDACATDIYASPLACAWGVGFFRDRYVRPDLLASSTVDPFFLNPLNLARLLRLSPPTFSLFVSMYLSRQNFPDVLFAIHSLKHGLFNIYPVDTKVMNMGFDGSGVHCSGSAAYSHKGFDGASKEHFVLELNDATNRHYTSSNARYATQQFGHRWRRSLYSYFLYLLCVVLGREATIRLRDLVKAGFRSVANVRN